MGIFVVAYEIGDDTRRDLMSNHLSAFGAVKLTANCWVAKVESTGAELYEKLKPLAGGNADALWVMRPTIDTCGHLNMDHAHRAVAIHELITQIQD